MSEEYNSTNSGEQVEVVDPQESYTNEFEMVEETLEDDSQAEIVDQQESEEAEETEIPEESEVQKQTREDNHAARAARLKAEREAKAKAEEMIQKAKAESDARIANSGAINPYTNKPFQSVEELEEYGKKVREAELIEQSQKTGKSIEQLNQEAEDAEYIKKKRQEESEAAAKLLAQEKKKEFFANDLIDFIERFPDVDVEKLDNNQKFRKFCGSRYGKEPLGDLYENYIEIVSDAEKIANAKAKADTRNNRSTGSGNSGGPTLTASQKSELDRWNRENPDMAMTPKEFLER